MNTHVSRVQPLIGAIACAVGAILAAACGDVYADPDSPEPTLDAGVVVDASRPGVFPDDTPPQCPPVRPRENSACSRTGSTCEYGKSADRECNSVLACSGMAPGGAWSARPVDPCFSISICPELADVASLDGKPCALEADGGRITDNDEAVCNMTDGVCACTTGRDDATKHERKWVCVRPISICPPNRPLLGGSCSGGLWCDYGSCSFKRGLLMECIEGVWLSGGARCQ
jgi:hypothetical protein